jgi:hypothetical protein
MVAHPLLCFPPSIAPRLPQDSIAKMGGALEGMWLWVDPIPDESVYYMNAELHILQTRQAIHGKRDLYREQMPQVFFDVHSMLVGTVVSKSWRASELATGLIWALNSWNLAVAATTARALVELAAAWNIESELFVDDWKKLRSTEIHSIEDFCKIRTAVYQQSKQMVWGTRLPSILGTAPQVQRTNILTLIEKASKRIEGLDLHASYDTLCDAVHPSWGSSECYWEELGISDEKQLRVLLNKRAIGKMDASLEPGAKGGSLLPVVIIHASTWALEQVVSDLRRFMVSVCNDLCLSAEVHELANVKYWGQVYPTERYELCGCGSGQKSKFCEHSFNLK